MEESDAPGATGGRKPLVSVRDFMTHIGRTQGDDATFDNIATEKLMVASEWIEGWNSETGRYWNTRQLTATFYAGDWQYFHLPGGEPERAAGPATGHIVNVAISGTPLSSESMFIYPDEGRWLLDLHMPARVPYGGNLTLQWNTRQAVVPAPVGEACMKLAASLVTDRGAALSPPTNLDLTAIRGLIRRWRIGNTTGIR